MLRFSPRKQAGQTPDSRIFVVRFSNKSVLVERSNACRGAPRSEQQGSAQKSAFYETVTEVNSNLRLSLLGNGVMFSRPGPRFVSAGSKCLKSPGFGNFFSPARHPLRVKAGTGFAQALHRLNGRALHECDEGDGEPLCR
jgi:hypothetical protein